MKMISKRGATFPFEIGDSGTAGTILFQISDGDNSPSVTSNTTGLNDGKWHNITVIRDIGTDKLYLYIDGGYDNSATDTTTSDISNANNVTIGYTSTGRRFEGTISHISFHNRRLTNVEIKSLYSEIHVPSENTLDYWKFDDESYDKKIQPTWVEDGIAGSHIGTNTGSNPPIPMQPVYIN